MTLSVLVESDSDPINIFEDSDKTDIYNLNLKLEK